MDRAQITQDLESMRQLTRRIALQLDDFSDEDHGSLQAILTDLSGLLRANNPQTPLQPPDTHPLENELRRLAQENRQQSALLDAIFAADPAGLAVVTGPELQFVYANPAYRYICPCLGQDPTGQAYPEVWSDEKEDGFFTQVKLVLDTGKPFQSLDVKRNFPDGSARVFTFQARRIEWENDLAALLILWDTTELYGTQNQLVHLLEQTHHQASQLQAVFTAMTDGVLIYDADGEAIQANPAVIQMMGFDPLGKTRAEVASKLAIWNIDGQILTVDELPSVRALRGETMTAVPYQVLNAAGRAYIVRMTVNLIHDAEQRVTGVVIVWHDVTGTEKRSVVFHQSEIRYRSLYENGLDGVLVTRPDGAILSANQQACRLFNMTEAEICQAGRSGLVVQDENLFAWIKERERNGQVSGELTLKRKDGSTFTGEAYSILFTDNDGSLKNSLVIRDITERKQTEALLLRYQLLFEHTRDITLFVRLSDGRILEANRAAELAYGYSRAELLNLTISDLRAPETHSQIDHQMARANTSGILFETRHRRKDGSIFPVEVSSQGAAFEGQSVNLSVIRDITEKKQVELDLIQEREWFQTAFASIGDAVITTDQHSLVTYLNPAAEKLTGWGIPEAARRPLEEVFQIINEETGRLTGEALMKGLHNSMGVGLTNRTALIARDGRVIPIEESVAPIQDSARQRQGIVIVFHDVTEKRKAELALLQSQADLRASETLYRSLFDGMTEGFALHQIICDEQGAPVDYRFLDVNPAFEQLTGLKQAEVKGKLHSQVEQLRGEDPKWIEIYGKVALTGEPVHFENHSPTLKIDYEVVAYRPAPFQFAVIYMDVTARKQAEAELRQAHETAERHHTQIEVQRRLIEQREQERMQIARDLHDGPVQVLTSVNYTLKIIEENLLEEAKKEETRAMRAAVLEAIHELRAYAQELRPPILFKFGLARAIESYLDSFREKHPELTVNLQVNWTHEPLSPGDSLPDTLRIALFRIFQESFNNIVKHAQARQTWVHLAMDESLVSMEIEDDGAGFQVPEDLLTLARQGHLGLVGVSERCTAIHGSLLIDSALGKGTRIQVQVPLGSSPS